VELKLYYLPEIDEFLKVLNTFNISCKTAQKSFIKSTKFNDPIIILTISLQGILVISFQQNVFVSPNILFLFPCHLSKYITGNFSLPFH
jgi:hypothetical protein